MSDSTSQEDKIWSSREPIDNAVSGTSRSVGVKVREKGGTFEGPYPVGRRDGNGIFYFHTGSIYVGNFSNGEMEGAGSMFFPRGEFFTGTFCLSKMQDGFLCNPEQGTAIAWKNGQPVGERLLPLPRHLQTAHTNLVSKVVTQVNSMFGDSCAAAAAATTPQQPELVKAAATSPPMVDFSTTSRRSPAADHHSPDNDLTNSFSTPNRLCGLQVDDAGARGAENLRDALTKSASLQTIFSCAAPEGNEYFSLLLFTKRIFAFLLPFLALPYTPFSPCRVTSLPQEREYVVSGATLRHDFDPPTYSLYVILGAMCLQICSIVLVACRVRLGKVQDGKVTLPEMVIPCVLWLHLGLFCSSYNSFLRMPHSLERLDRNLTPKLSAFAASVVDARSKVCIYTWDEEGRSKVRNSHYRLRWFFFSVFFGAIMSFAAPSTRGGFGYNMFGETGFEKAASLCSFFSTFFFCGVQTYYILKITDMERETGAKLAVLTELAFLEQRSIVKPSSDIGQPFEIDLDFSITDLFHGFPGWFTTRSIVLYASTCANHCARYSSMSIFVVCMAITFIIALSDVFYMLANGYTRSKNYFSTAHAYGLFVILFWGALLTRYLCTCAGTKREYLRHLYVMDISSMYHFVKKENREAGEIVEKCRNMAKTHDIVPNFFGLPYYPLVVIFFVVLGLAALAAIAFQLGEVIYY